MIQETINKSTCILLPSGRDYNHCADILHDAFGVFVPEFPERTLIAKTAGRMFIKVKSRDVPMLIEHGYGDVGLAYTDICQEKIAADSSIAYEIIGESLLKFCLLFPEANVKSLEERLGAPELAPVVVATSYPTVLKNCIAQALGEGRNLNIVISPITPSGSVESMVALGLADVAADVVNTGVTAAANSLQPFPLMNIYPALVYRK